MFFGYKNISSHGNRLTGPFGNEYIVGAYLTKLAFSKKAKSQIINIGPDEEFVTINELANTIANLLAEWGLITLVSPNATEELTVPLNQLKILSFKEKDEWNLTAKYNIGSKKVEDEM